MSMKVSVTLILAYTILRLCLNIDFFWYQPSMMLSIQIWCRGNQDGRRLTGRWIWSVPDGVSIKLPKGLMLLLFG